MIFLLQLASAYGYYGGYLGGAPEQEYTTYHITKNSPYGYYDKTYTKSSYQTPGREVTTIKYTIQDNNLYNYPSRTYKTYTTTKTTGFSYIGGNYPLQERACSGWHCQPQFADTKHYYSSDYPNVYYYSPYYDTEKQYYVWDW